VCSSDLKPGPDGLVTAFDYALAKNQSTPEMSEKVELTADGVIRLRPTEVTPA